jgi:hypothetical protein
VCDRGRAEAQLASPLARARAVGGALQDVDEARVRLERGDELRDRREQRVVGRAQREQLAEIDQRLALLALLVEQLGSVAVQRLELLARSEAHARTQDARGVERPIALLERAAEQPQRVAAGARGGVVGAEHALGELQRRLVTGLIGEHATQHVERGRRVLQLVEPAARDLHLETRRIGGTEPVEARVPQRDQLAPALAALEQALEHRAQLRIVRAQRHESFEELDGAIGVVRQVLGHAHRVVEQLDLPLEAVGGVDGALVHVEQLWPAAGGSHAHHHPVEHRLVAGIELEDAEQHGAHLRRFVAEPLLAEAGGTLADALEAGSGQLPRQHLGIELGHRLWRLRLRGELFELVPGAVVFGTFTRGRERLGERNVLEVRRHLDSSRTRSARSVTSL